MRAFERFPTWMWRNVEVDAFIRWLRGHNKGRAYEEMCGFYGLDLYNLSALDARGDRLPRRAGSRARAARAPPLRLPRAVGRQPGRLRPPFADRGLCALRGRGGPHARRPFAARRRLLRRGVRRMARRAGERAARQGRRGLLPGDVLRLRRELEFARHAHVRHAEHDPRRQGAGLEGDRVGAQQPHRQCRLHRHGPRARRAQHRPAGEGEVRREGAADRLRHAHRYGRCRRRLGRADADQARAAVAPRQPRTHVATTRNRRATFSTCAKARPTRGFAQS